MNACSPTDIDTIAMELLEGKIGVLPTDTIYGLHCLASRKDLIKKVAQLKNREETMPMITLISSFADLTSYGISLNDFGRKALENLWPGRNTVIFELPDHSTVGLRFPDNPFLTSVIKKTGPLISTSANVHEKPNALDVDEAYGYFGDKVDFYVNAGSLNNPPSKIFKLHANSLEKLR